MTLKYHQKFKEGEGSFYAKDGSEEVSNLEVNFSENSFPYVYSMNTLESHRGRGIMETLLKRADSFYWNVNRKKLRSSRNPDDSVQGYYERLEKKGLVERVMDKRRADFGRWIFK